MEGGVWGDGRKGEGCGERDGRGGVEREKEGEGAWGREAGLWRVRWGGDCVHKKGEGNRCTKRGERDGREGKENGGEGKRKRGTAQEV